MTAAVATRKGWGPQGLPPRHRRQILDPTAVTTGYGLGRSRNVLGEGGGAMCVFIYLTLPMEGRVVGPSPTHGDVYEVGISRLRVVLTHGWTACGKSPNKPPHVYMYIHK